MACFLRATRSALETAHSAFCLHILYTYVVSWAGDTLAVANLVWSVFSVDSFELGLLMWYFRSSGVRVQF